MFTIQICSKWVERFFLFHSATCLCYQIMCLPTKGHTEQTSYRLHLSVSINYCVLKHEKYILGCIKFGWPLSSAERISSSRHVQKWYYNWWCRMNFVFERWEKKWRKPTTLWDELAFGVIYPIFYWRKTILEQNLSAKLMLLFLFRLFSPGITEKQNSFCQNG